MDQESKQIIDDRTSNLSLQLPHKNNGLDVDVSRLRNAFVEIDAMLKCTAVDKGVITAGSTVTFLFSDGEFQSATFQTGPVNIAIDGYDETRRRYMMLQLNGAGLIALTFPVIYWVAPDGTYTTNMATYMEFMGRAALSSTMPTWIVVWQVGSIIYGKLL